MGRVLTRPEPHTVCGLRVGGTREGLELSLHLRVNPNANSEAAPSLNSIGPLPRAQEAPARGFFSWEPPELHGLVLVRSGRPGLRAVITRPEGSGRGVLAPSGHSEGGQDHSGTEKQEGAGHNVALSSRLLALRLGSARPGPHVEGTPHLTQRQLPARP